MVVHAHAKQLLYKRGRYRLRFACRTRVFMMQNIFNHYIRHPAFV